MYGLLVNRWPLHGQAATKGWDSVATDAEGRIKEPAALNSRVPFLISSAAAGLVRDGDGIRSAKTLSTLLREASARLFEVSIPRCISFILQSFSDWMHVDHAAGELK